MVGSCDGYSDDEFHPEEEDFGKSNVPNACSIYESESSIKFSNSNSQSPISNSFLNESCSTKSNNIFRDFTNISIEDILENLESVTLSERELRILGVVDEGDRYSLVYVGDNDNHHKTEKINQKLSEDRIEVLSKPRIRTNPVQPGFSRPNVNSLHYVRSNTQKNKRINLNQVKTFCKRMEDREKGRIAKLQNKVAEQQYKRCLDKKVCHRCGNTQSFIEQLYQRNFCSNPKCNKNEYLPRATFSGEQFFHRMSKINQMKDFKLKLIHHQREDELRKMCLLRKKPSRQYIGERSISQVNNEHDKKPDCISYRRNGKSNHCKEIKSLNIEIDKADKPVNDEAKYDRSCQEEEERPDSIHQEIDNNHIRRDCINYQRQIKSNHNKEKKNLNIENGKTRQIAIADKSNNDEAKYERSCQEHSIVQEEEKRPDIIHREIDHLLKISHVYFRDNKKCCGDEKSGA